PALEPAVLNPVDLLPYPGAWDLRAGPFVAAALMTLVRPGDSRLIQVPLAGCYRRQRCEPSSFHRGEDRLAADRCDRIGFQLRTHIQHRGDGGIIDPRRRPRSPGPVTETGFAFGYEPVHPLVDPLPGPAQPSSDLRLLRARTHQPNRLT